MHDPWIALKSNVSAPAHPSYAYLHNTNSQVYTNLQRCLEAGVAQVLVHVAGVRGHVLHHGHEVWLRQVTTRLRVLGLLQKYHSQDRERCQVEGFSMFIPC